MLLTTLAALAAETFDGHSYWYGDPHAHTGISHDGKSSDLGEGCPDGDCLAFADVFDTAVANGLDWVLLSDHINGGNDYSATDDEFFTLLAKDLSADNPDLVVIPGAEIWITTGGEWLGHKNLFYFDDPTNLGALSIDDIRPSGGSAADVADCEAFWTWMDGFVGTWGDALLVPHHPMTEHPAPTDWSCHSDDYEPAVEVYSGWGDSLGWDIDYDLPAYPWPDGAVQVALDDFGLRMGFLAGTDEHRTVPGDLCQGSYALRVSSGGLTMAVLPEGAKLDRTELRAAFVEHRTLATTGPRVPMVPVWTATDGQSWGLGEAVTYTRGTGLHLDVTLASEPTTVLLVTPDGDLGLTRGADGTWSTDLVAVPAWAYVAAEFSQSALGLCDDANGVDEEWVWSSPNWFDVQEPVRDSGPGDSADSPAPVDSADSPTESGVADSPVDSADSTDTVGPVITEDGCRCGTPSRGSWLVAGLGVLGWRRRRAGSGG